MLQGDIKHINIVKLSLQDDIKQFDIILQPWYPSVLGHSKEFEPFEGYDRVKSRYREDIDLGELEGAWLQAILPQARPCIYLEAVNCQYGSPYRDLDLKYAVE